MTTQISFRGQPVILDEEVEEGTTTSTTTTSRWDSCHRQVGLCYELYGGFLNLCRTCNSNYIKRTERLRRSKVEEEPSTSD